MAEYRGPYHIKKSRFNVFAEDFRESMKLYVRLFGSPQNVVDLTNVLYDLQRDGVHMTLELVARLSPYLTEHLKRFGHYILDMETPPESLQPKPLFVTAP